VVVGGRPRGICCWGWRAGLGGCGVLRALVFVELLEVADEVHERPFAGGGWESAAAEVVDPRFVLGSSTL